MTRNNALAETTIGLYKTECVREASPFRTGPVAGPADLEDITSAWVQQHQPAHAPPGSTPTLRS
jgi:putative transposase